MSSDIFAGNQNNVARSISKIWAGSENNIAMPVKGVFIGDPNNQAKKVWPMSILPTGYQQLEWIRFNENDCGGLNTYVSGTIYPRIVMSYTFPDNPTSISNLFAHLAYYRYTGPSGTYIWHDVYSYYATPSHFVWEYNPSSGSVTHGFNDSISYEGILTNTIYTLDFNKKEGNYYYVYLYNTEGYYSIPEHNLICGGPGFNMPSSNWYLNSQTVILFLNSTYSGSPNNKYSFIYKNPCPMILYSCQMYDNENNTLIRNFFPCYRKSDNAVGLFDLVNLTFHRFGSLTTDSEKIVVGPTV